MSLAQPYFEVQALIDDTLRLERKGSSVHCESCIDPLYFVDTSRKGQFSGRSRTTLLHLGIRSSITLSQLLPLRFPGAGREQATQGKPMDCPSGAFLQERMRSTLTVEELAITSCASRSSWTRTYRIPISGGELGFRFLMNCRNDGTENAAESSPLGRFGRKLSRLRQFVLDALPHDPSAPRSHEETGNRH